MFTPFVQVLLALLFLLPVGYAVLHFIQGLFLLVAAKRESSLLKRQSACRTLRRAATALVVLLLLFFLLSTFIWRGSSH